jgi:hypothetical protein
LPVGVTQPCCGAARGRRVLLGDDGDFFVSAGGGPRGANVGTVNAPEVPVDQSYAIEFDLQGVDDAGEHAVATPLGEVVVHRLSGIESFGQITLGRAGVQIPEPATIGLLVIGGLVMIRRRR